MAYVFDEPRIGMLQIAAVDSGFTPPNQATAIPTPPNVLGTVVRAFDATLGEGEFILLKGVANTIVGSAVTYDGSTYATTLAATTQFQGRPIVWAMSANIAATTFGWYQTEGTVTAAKGTARIQPKVAIGITTTGLVGNVNSGIQVLGARSANAATVLTATTTVLLVVNRPHLQGRIT